MFKENIHGIQWSLMEIDKPKDSSRGYQTSLKKLAGGWRMVGFQQQIAIWVVCWCQPRMNNVLLATLVWKCLRYTSRLTNGSLMDIPICIYVLKHVWLRVKNHYMIGVEPSCCEVLSCPCAYVLWSKGPSKKKIRLRSSTFKDTKKTSNNSM